MKTSTPSRRAMLGSIALAAPVAALAASSGLAAIPTPAADRGPWDRAFANMQRHQAADAAFLPIYMAAYDGYEHDKPSEKDIDLRIISPIITADWRRDLLHRGDVAKLHADFLEAQGKLWGASNPAAYAAKHKAACDRILQFRREVQAAKDLHNYDAVMERGEALADAAYGATWSLYRLPAPDLAAPHWKIEHLFGRATDDDGDGADAWSKTVMQTLLADVRRLLPQDA